MPPSEAGHLTFAARGADQLDLSQFLEAKLGHVGVEDILSGRGLERCYAWASARADANETATTAEIFAAADAGDPVAEQAIRAFVTALGNVTGDLALTLLPFGGIYLVGGMSRAVAPWFDRCGFDAAMTDKGRFSDFLNAFSVRLVEDDYAALSGCAHFLARLGQPIVRHRDRQPGSETPMYGWIEYVLAFIAFFLTHSIPVRPPVKARFVASLGARGFTLAYSLLSIAALAWVIVAAGRAPFVNLWDWGSLGKTMSR